MPISFLRYEKMQAITGKGVKADMAGLPTASFHLHTLKGHISFIGHSG
jgi:hypothetical protein